MKTITLARAIEVLDSCTAVYLDDESLVFPEVRYGEGQEGLSDDEDARIFLILNSSMGGEEVFCAEQNETVPIGPDGHLMLVNANGDKAKVMPLICAPVRP